jgi:hypothetical protein
MHWQAGWEMLTGLGTVGLMLVTATGFIFLWKQLRDGRQSLENQTRWQIYQLSFHVYRMLVELPNLRPYFYENKAVPEDEPAKSQVFAAAELMLDYFENIFLSKEAVDPDTWEVWKRYMRQLCTTSPALRAFAEGSQAYEPRFVQILREEDVNAQRRKAG